MLLSLSWLQGTKFFSYIRDSTIAYPLLLSLHIVALAFFGGMIVVTNLRLLGLGMRSYSIEELVNGLRAPKRFGFVLAAFCGVLLFGSKAEQYSYDRGFWIKLGLLVLIAVNYMVFRRSVYQNTAELDRAPQMSGTAKVAAALSTLLWIGVVCAGRGPPATIKDMMHSMVDPSGDFLFKSVQQVADEHGASQKAPQSEADWDDVRQRLLILSDVPAALTAPGRLAAKPKYRSRNPEVENGPAEVQQLLDADQNRFRPPRPPASRRSLSGVASGGRKRSRSAVPRPGWHR